MPKTFQARAQDVTHDWYVVDATDQVLGRLATQIADTLRGKRKPIYTAHVDTGDFVIVLNAAKVAVTGNKRTQKLYRRHSGYPGGLRARTFNEEIEKRPTEVIRTAVRGMLPHTKLGRAQLRKLRVYVGTDHPHGQHDPQPLRLDLLAGPDASPTTPASESQDAA